MSDQESGNDTGLKNTLQGRHITMIAVGGVIGAGFFLGAGDAIAKAGPAVILAYVAGGILTFLVLMMLIEMAVGRPRAGSFQTYARDAFGGGAGFVTGWTYFFAFLIGPASETIAAGTFLHGWFPTVPIWVFALVVAALMTSVNLIGVFVFGEVEFWLALLKVLALVGFIIWGCIAVLGLTPVQSPSIGNLVNEGGFAPAGFGGVVGALLIVMFAYGGTESIGTAAEESSDPARHMPKVLRSSIIRIVVLFIVSIGLLVMVLPWQKAGTASSPFVDAMGILGGPAAANVMNFIVLTATFSTIDAGVYASSRMLYSMSRDGYFPKVFSRVAARRRVPTGAIIASCSVLFLGAIFFVVFPDFAYVWLASLSGFGFMFTWLMISLSHSRVRKQLQAEGKLGWKAPGMPVLQWLAVLIIFATFAGQFFIEDGYIMIVAGCVWIVVALLYYVFIGKPRAQRGERRAREG